MIKVSVMYPNTPGARFDHEYYRDRHMPLVKELMGDSCKHYTVDKGLAGGRPTLRPSMWGCAISSAIQSRRFRRGSARMQRQSWPTLRTTQTRRRCSKSAKWSLAELSRDAVCDLRACQAAAFDGRGGCDWRARSR